MTLILGVTTRAFELWNINWKRDSLKKGERERINGRSWKEHKAILGL